MKKILVVMAAVIATVSVSAQIEFKQLIDSIDWCITESEILERYPDDIIKGRHFYSDYDKTMADYEFVNIILGDLTGSVCIYVDSVSRKVHSLRLKFNDIEKIKDAETLSREMDNILFPLFGEPDERIDEHGKEYMNHLDRTWYKDTYIASVSHMVFSDAHFYSLTIKGIENKGNDFRVAKWGESKESIMAKEGKEDSLNDESLYLFSDLVAGLNCDVVYIFTNNKLAMSKYMFNPKHSNKNDFISDFRDLVGLMTEKYGEPSYNAPEWRNSLYKSDPDDYGFAISLGHLSYSAGWLGDTTDITVALYGENYDITLMIQYVSKKYENLRKNQNIKEKTKDL